MKIELAKPYVELSGDFLEKVIRIIERSNKEIGGSLKVSVIRDRDYLVYYIYDVGKPSTTSPFLWIYRPRNSGSEISFTDQNTLRKRCGYQILVLRSMPSLIIIFSYRENEREFNHDASKEVVMELNDGCLEYKAYTAAPSLKSFHISEEVDNKIVFHKEYLDDKNCEEAYLFKSHSDQNKVFMFKPICTKLIIKNIDKISVKYPESIKAILSEIYGIYSRGCLVDYVDLMQLVSLQYYLRFRNLYRNEFYLVKECGRVYRVKIVNEIDLDVVNLESRPVCFTRDDYSKNSQY